MTHPALRAPLPRGDLYLTVATYNSPLLGGVPDTSRRSTKCEDGRAGWVRSAGGDSALCSFIPRKPGLGVTFNEDVAQQNLKEGYSFF